MDTYVSECNDLNPIIELFSSHRDQPFTYLADIPLLRIISRLEQCKIFQAKANEQIVGCIYAMKYMYDYGWIGGILVHNEFRRRGIAKKLMKEALSYLKSPYVYLFVEPENTIARKFFESVGFNMFYRRLNYREEVPSNQPTTDTNITYDVEWHDLVEASGFRERGGIVNLGFYPIKMTESIFTDLKIKKKILRCGDIIAILEKSYEVNTDGHTFAFNDYILNRTSIPVGKSIIEINPFYVRPQMLDFINLLTNFTECKELVIWTHEGDPILTKPPLKASLGGLVMELYKCIQGPR